MNGIKNYLRLSREYCKFLGGVRWSAVDDSLVYPDGITFAFNEEVAQFLEGLSSGGRLIHFGHALHLLDLLRQPRAATHPEAARLQRLFGRAGRPVRNAGAFCAAVCRDLPEPAVPVYPEHVCDRLRNESVPIRWFIVSFHDTFAAAERAPLEPPDFERRVLTRTAAYRDDELLAWFTSGRGPVKEAGDALAREMPRRRSLDGALAALLERPRLAGAAGFVGQLVGALALPPRRLERQELPVGGYSDVTTHGRLDQILPSQFALDELDFLRRLAEQELLYFRREEPPRPTRQEMVVLLDQGVRTWGDVRLVLGAAVLALGRQAARRVVPFFVAATGNGGEVLDPLEADAEALGELVEASDLSANPGLALERVLETASDTPRDVVLLTHPRALAEEDVRAAARRLAAQDRLFALSLDGHGAAELSELRRGVPVRLRQFRVDFTRSSPRPVKRDDSPADALPPWRGDVEPVGYPFRFGISGAVRPGHFTFDHGGEWLLAAADHGMLYVWKADGSRSEILPRGMTGGAVLKTVAGVAGVSGGFVVAGAVRGETVLFHYDLAARACTGHAVKPIPAGATLCYLPEYHAVIAAPPGMYEGWAFDLATGRGHGADDTLEPSNRAATAWQHCLSRGLPVWSLPVTLYDRLMETLPTHASDLPSPGLEVDAGGKVALHGVPPWGVFTPRADGQPVLKACTVIRAQCRGNTLALVINRSGPEPGVTLRLFRGPEGVPLASFPFDPRAIDFTAMGFTLSSDGRLLAFRGRKNRLDIRKVDGSAPPVLIQTGGFSGATILTLGHRCLLLLTGGGHAHLLEWDTGRLELKHASDGGGGLIRDHQELLVSPVPEAGPAGVPESLHYDPARFLQGTTREVTVVGDRYGQVTVFDRKGRLVCMFFAFRHTLAGWLPDGTRLGPAGLTGGPESAGAMEKFGRALKSACEMGSPPA
jgi:hypothetical protein